MNLREEYTRQVEQLIETYPGQERNRARYLRWAEDAQEGITTRRIGFKGFVLARGTRVLFKQDEHDDGLSIWIPRGRGNFHKALVDLGDVRAVCGLCGGSGRIRHHMGFVSFPCPSC
jgi:hypothetical protein